VRHMHNRAPVCGHIAGRGLQQLRRGADGMPAGAGCAGGSASTGGLHVINGPGGNR
jgi:hypothetical protein